MNAVKEIVRSLQITPTYRNISKRMIIENFVIMWTNDVCVCAYLVYGMGCMTELLCDGGFQPRSVTTTVL